jgi:hypothetical protein
MLYASYNGQLVRATPGLRGAVCTGCGGQVIAKCGALVPPYFAHLSGFDCDPWIEPETPWHRSWKACFPPDWCELKLDTHRADVHTPGGVTIEFQHSSIGLPAVRERTAYYSRFGALYWVLDLTHQVEWSIPVWDKPHVFCNYSWRTPRRSFLPAFGHLWLELPGEVMLRLDTVADQRPGRWYGQGCAMRRADWLAVLRRDGKLPTAWRALKYAVVQGK